MTNDLDRLARVTHDLVTEVADRQVSREIAHLAVIEVDTVDPGDLVAPEGYRAPAGGAVTTLVVARSRETPEASTRMRVAVWIAEDGSGVLVTRTDSTKPLVVAPPEADPEITPQLRGRVNDFVALIIAHMVAGLNVAMHRAMLHESAGDVAEYDEG